MVLIVTPLPIELKALKRALGSVSGVEFAVGGHGKVQFALSTLLLMQQHSPRLVIGVGAAGSLTDEVKSLDVVAAEWTIEHDFRLHFVQRPQPRFAGDAASLTKLRGAPELSGFKLHFGGIASGDEDVVLETRAAEIFATTRALAVAWEGAGLARACVLHGTPFIEIRAITDMADANAPQAFAENLAVGMEHAAQVIRSLL